MRSFVGGLELIVSLLKSDDREVNFPTQHELFLIDQFINIFSFSGTLVLCL